MRFWNPFWGRGLGATYDVHLRLTGKRIVDFLLVLIELFFLGVTAEELLRAKIDRKSAHCKRVVYTHQIFA